MIGGMHAVQISHLHHHRHCLEDDDAEGSTARLSWRGSRSSVARCKKRNILRTLHRPHKPHVKSIA
jgi:hypothetical protein